MTLKFDTPVYFGNAQQQLCKSWADEYRPLSFGFQLNFGNLALANRVFSGQAGSRTFPPNLRKALDVSGNAIKHLKIVRINLIINILLDIPVLFGHSIEVYLIQIVIAIPLFFSWKRIFKNKLKANSTRRIITWAATIISTPIIYTGFIWLFIYGITYSPSKSFNKASWLTHKSTRYEMAGDLIYSKQLIGLDTIQVKEILGVPTSINVIDSSGNHIRNWSYDMGSGGGGLGFLFHNLLVKFENEKVVTVEHIELKD